MKATPDNTLFVTVRTHRTNDFYVTMATARKNDIYVDVLTPNAGVPNFWELKTRPVYQHISQKRKEGKKYVVYFDAYDVIFLNHRDAILQRLNDVYMDRVLFCADYPLSLYPYTKSDGWYDHDQLKSSWLIDYIQHGNKETSNLLNAGIYAGRIDHVLSLFDTVGLTKKDFLNRKLSIPIAERLYEDLSSEKVKIDDQLALWLNMLVHPELYHIDSRKEFVTVGVTNQMTARSIDEYRKPTKHRPLKCGTNIGDAMIIHSAGGSHRNMGAVYRYGLHEPMCVSFDEHQRLDERYNHAFYSRYNTLQKITDE